MTASMVICMMMVREEDEMVSMCMMNVEVYMNVYMVECMVMDVQRSDRGQGWGSLCPSSQQHGRYRTTGCIFKDINTFYSHRMVSSTDTIW